MNLMVFNIYKKYKLRKGPNIKLHVGCGNNYFDSWINIDIDSPKADIYHDMTKPLWLFDNTVDFIYSEHFIEHIKIFQAQKLFKEFYRVLKDNGVLRVATPDLDYIVSKFNSDWHEQDWIRLHNYSHLKTSAEMLNLCFYEWGHQYLYNQEELTRRLEDAGFKMVQRQTINESQYPELRGRETRTDSKLIVEAIKQGDRLWTNIIFPT